MAGIYIHIPFCRQACNYCNFHFTTSLHYRKELVNALSIETEKEREYFGGEIVETIYFGGGTPSLLENKDIDQLLASIRENYIVAPDVEITLEANPDDINMDKIRGWKNSGINRLSIGIQSFFEEELRWMNRAHTTLQAIQSLKLAKEHFDNITIDLIYGSPISNDQIWKQNIDMAVNFGISHLSCYALTVEEKTPLSKLISTKKLADVDPDKQARQFLLLMKWMREKGYEHYEVSNFARPGYRSLHNSSYWKGEKYLGLGPSAHSYNGTERRWNIANNNQYIQSINEGSPKRESETLTAAQQLNEYIMISLRTLEGLDINEVEKNWGPEEVNRVKSSAEKFICQDLIRINGAHLQLTDEGMLKADGIAAALFS